MSKKKLTRSKKDKMVAGVLAGVGDYYSVDPTIVRILFIVAASFSGFIPGLLVYAIAAIIIPEK